MVINQDNSLKSKIRLSCRKDGERTLLVDSFFTVPYKLTHYGTTHAYQHLEMIQMCASPGVMDGDSLDLQISCEDHTEMKFFTQSYNKIHPMPRKLGGQQQTNIRLGKNALFQFVPHPTIPFDQSIFRATTRIDMAADAHLIWCDIISGGRIHSGERFQLASYRSLTQIYQNKQLVLYDNQLLAPGRQPIEDLLFFEGYTHQATFIVQSSFAHELKKELDEMLTAQTPDMSYGYTSCTSNGLMLRALAYSGDYLHNWLSSMADMCWDFIRFHRQAAPVSAADGIDSVPEKPAPVKKAASSTKARKRPARTPCKTEVLENTTL